MLIMVLSYLHFGSALAINTSNCKTYYSHASNPNSPIINENLNQKTVYLNVQYVICILVSHLEAFMWFLPKFTLPPSVRDAAGVKSLENPTTLIEHIY